MGPGVSVVLLPVFCQLIQVQVLCMILPLRARNRGKLQVLHILARVTCPLRARNAHVMLT